MRFNKRDSTDTVDFLYLEHWRKTKGSCVSEKTLICQRCLGQGWLVYLGYLGKSIRVLVDGSLIFDVY